MTVESRGLQLVGRRSSLFTRLPLLFAEQLDVACELVPIHDMTVVDPAAYAGNPALKLPILRDGERVLLGALNICRAIVERADVAESAPVVWPEMLRDDLSRNAQELVWHSMSAQVQLVMGTAIAGLPADNVYFDKARKGLIGALAWLDMHLPAVLQLLPAQRELSVFEASLFCLVEHLEFRPSVSLASCADLRAFAHRYGESPAARRTSYRFDPRPAE